MIDDANTQESENEYQILSSKLADGVSIKLIMDEGSMRIDAQPTRRGFAKQRMSGDLKATGSFVTTGKMMDRTFELPQSIAKKMEEKGYGFAKEPGLVLLNDMQDEASIPSYLGGDTIKTIPASKKTADVVADFEEAYTQAIDDIKAGRADKKQAAIMAIEKELKAAGADPALAPRLADAAIKALTHSQGAGRG